MVHEYFYVYNAPRQYHYDHRGDHHHDRGDTRRPGPPPTTTVPPAPTVTGVSPASGPNGALVTLAGTGFTGATAVNFGTNPATFTVNSDNIITAVAPPAPALSTSP